MDECLSVEEQLSRMQGVAPHGAARCLYRRPPDLDRLTSKVSQHRVVAEKRTGEIGLTFSRRQELPATTGGAVCRRIWVPQLSGANRGGSDGRAHGSSDSI
eukprot:GHVU01168779.1.p2 GENE.GHVU01168779.1~~GHVU01168779.1.p2  ORF type:complete len:101 (-),score=8.74 GHVU01168779.1:705-1007(-)